jgi:ABC-type sugar transport system substrate-binding protein
MRPFDPDGRVVAALLYVLVLLTAMLIGSPVMAEPVQGKRLAYLVSDLRIPFWDIMHRGMRRQANALGYELDVYSAENSKKAELRAVADVIRSRADGIILSPTDSSAAVTVLKLAAQVGIPVVISDIGTDGGEFVSYISSDNYAGAYGVGQILVEAMQARGWQDASVGIIGIPQSRANGQARTAGFIKALKEGGIRSGALRQQVDFSYRETYDFARQLIDADPNLRALWLQGSDRYEAALDAIANSGRSGEILLICFDAEPEFVQMIRRGELVGAGMQQPFLMGERAVQAMHAHLQGEPVEHEQLLEVLAVSSDNIGTLLPAIERNVLGLSAD